MFTSRCFTLPFSLFLPKPMYKHLKLSLLFTALIAIASTSLAANELHALPQPTSAAPSSAAPATAPVTSYLPPATLPAVSDVEALGQLWGQTLAGRDPAKIAALYHSEAVLLATFSNELDTQPEILSYFAGLTQKEGLNVRFDQQNIRILDEDTVSNSGLYTFSYTEDGKTVSVPARYTFLYEKQGDNWLIVEHHSSIRPEASN
jgi:uncharacterized protein (TIGR02246 family)